MEQPQTTINNEQFIHETPSKHKPEEESKDNQTNITSPTSSLFSPTSFGLSSPFRSLLSPLSFNRLPITVQPITIDSLEHLTHRTRYKQLTDSIHYIHEDIKASSPNKDNLSSFSAIQNEHASILQQQLQQGQQTYRTLSHSQSEPTLRNSTTEEKQPTGKQMLQEMKQIISKGRFSAI